MAAVWRIRDRATFDELRRRGRRVRRGPFTVTWLPEQGSGPARVAYSVGRGVGSAVVRNRLRRRLRHQVAALAAELPPGAYLIGAGSEAVLLSSGEVRATLSTAFSALVAQPAR